jgi:hypothetical protein
MMVMGEPEAEQEDRWRTVRAARSELCDSGVALYPDIERATRTLGRYVRYLAERRALASDPATPGGMQYGARG